MLGSDLAHARNVVHLRNPLSKRFYHIAFDLGLAPRQFMKELAGRGLSVGNQMTLIGEELERRIREISESLRAGRARAHEAAAVHDGEGRGAPIEEIVEVEEPVEETFVT